MTPSDREDPADIIGRRHPLPKDEVIRVCVALAEEEQRRAEGEDVRFQTITDISAWLESLVGRPA